MSSISAPVTDQIEATIRDAMPVEYFHLVNDSHRHAGPATDSHFNLTVVSEDMTGLSAVKRHQLVYRLLAEQLAGPVHALALHLYTPEEWKQKGMVSPDSPDCRGGS